jgi:hypothetical protein
MDGLIVSLLGIQSTFRQQSLKSLHLDFNNILKQANMTPETVAARPKIKESLHIRDIYII